MHNPQDNGIIYYEIQPQRRFVTSYLPFVDDESAYTEEELALRELILAARAHSLHSDYLQTSILWYQPDMADAFVIQHENSWILPQRYIPKARMSQDDFIIEDLPAVDVKWPVAEVLMKEIGDYLHIRNKAILNNYPSHINQPLNFFFLDIVSILKKMAMDANAERVYENLEYLASYIRKVEKQVRVGSGSDKVFLYDLNKKITTNFKNRVKLRIDPKELREITLRQLSALNDYIKKVNFVLHFSFSEKLVNPHAYAKYLDNAELPQHKLEQFPVVRMSRQLQHGGAVSVLEQGLVADFSNDDIVEKLHKIRNQQFVKEVNLDDKILYARTLLQLQQLIEYKNVFNDFVKLLDNTGEVIALLQFNQVLNIILDELAQLIQKSSKTVIAIDTKNSWIYHHKIRQHLESDKDFIENYNRLHRDDLNLDLSAYLLEINKATAAMRHKIDEMANAYSRQQLIDETNNSMMRVQKGLQRLLPSVEFDKLLSIPDTPALLSPPQSITELHPAEPLAQARLIAEDLTMAVSSSAMKLTPTLPSIEKIWDLSASLLSASSPIQTDFSPLTIPTGSTYVGDSANSFSLPCQAGYDSNNQTILQCFGDQFIASVYIPGGESTQLTTSHYQARQSPITGDSYGNCYPINYYDHDSLVCEGKDTNAIFTPINKRQLGFNDVASTLLLGAVMWQIGKGIYSWFNSEADSKEEVVELIDEDEWRQNLQLCRDKLNQLMLLGDDSSGDEVDFVLKELEYDLQDCLSGQKSLSQLKELNEDIDYAIASFTLATEEHIQKFKHDVQEQLHRLGVTEDCIKSIRRLMTAFRCRGKLLDVAKLYQLNLSPQQLLLIVDNIELTQQIVSSPEKIYLNEISDIVKSSQQCQKVSVTILTQSEWGQQLSQLLSAKFNSGQSATTNYSTMFYQPSSLQKHEHICKSSEISLRYSGK